MENNVDGYGAKPGKQQGGSTRLLVFLVLLFALTTVALAAALAVTTIKFSEYKNDEETVQPEPQSQAGQSGQKAGQPCPTQPAPVPTTTKPAEAEVCETEGCVLAAARVINAMDPTVDPCDDFYQFACGRWIREHPIPEDKSDFSSFIKLRDDVSIIVKEVLEADNLPTDPESVKKARMYFGACRNESSIEDLGLAYLQQYMTAFGGWPVLGQKAGGKWDGGTYKLENLLAHTKRGSNYPPLIDFGVSQDDKDPEHYILYIDQPDLGMPSRDYYLKDRADPTLMAYQKFIEQFAVAMGADPTMAANDAKDIVDLEIEIANITIPREERRDPEKLYNKMTIAEVKTAYPGVDWSSLLPKMMQIVDITITDIEPIINVDWSSLLQQMMQIVGITITDTEPIINVAPDYFIKLDDLITRFPHRTMANYIVSRRVVGKTYFLPKNFRDLQQDYTFALSGTTSAAPRWQRCGDTVTGALSEVVGRLFVIQAFKEDAKKDVLDLVDKLRESFKEMLDALPWMGDATKVIAKQKADAIDPRIGYPDIVYNNTALDAKFKDIIISANDPMRSLVSIGEAEVKEKLGKLRKTYDRSSWGMSSATVNAYYDPEANQITFPAAILQPPFYTKDQPAYLNYGGIGYVIGHEITHGFDDQGRQFDKDGHLKNWWTPEDATKFEQRAQCIIDQYSNFTVPGTGGMHLNGITTQGENIADNGGIKESFKAYRKWVANRGSEEPLLPGVKYNQNQLYFLNAAQVWCDNMRDKDKIRLILTDPHPIDMYRVYGPLQNFDEFSKAWSCPIGSTMNKANKCAVW